MFAELIRRSIRLSQNALFKITTHLLNIGRFIESVVKIFLAAYQLRQILHFALSHLALPDNT